MTTTETADPATQIEQSLTELAADITGAATYENSDLTGPALTQAREQRLREAITRHADAAITAAAQASRTAADARDHCAKYAFNPDQVDTAATTAAWTNSVLPAIESGRPDWQALLSTATPAELAAVDTYIPRYLRTHAGLDVEAKLNAEATIANLKDGVQDRWYAISPDPAAKAAWTTAARTARVAGVAQRTARELTSGRVRNRSHVALLTTGIKSTRL